jgi:MoaA/NifB/PqqE/SkfB family radical SAM enzyme
MYKELAEAIRYVKQDLKYPYVFLTTNGRLSTPKKLKAVMEAGLDSLKFSFNNANEEQFAHVTQIAPRNFNKIIANIKSAKEIRDENNYSCGIYASSIKYDGEQQEKMEEAVKEIVDYVDEHYWLPLYGQAGLTAGADDTQPVAGNTGRLDNMRDALPCWSIFTEGHVTYDMHLSACCFDHDGRFNMGNLDKISFKDAWVSEPFQKLRQANLNLDVTGTACEKCIAYS